MSEADLLFHTSQALVLVLLLSLPPIVVAALVGLLVGLFQGLTQIQDQTISFALRLIAVVVTLALSMRWIGVELNKFAVEMFNAIALVPP